MHLVVIKVNSAIVGSSNVSKRTKNKNNIVYIFHSDLVWRMQLMIIKD